MSVPLDICIVRRAREIISYPEHWCQGGMSFAADGRATDPDNDDAASFCLVGAIERAAHELGLGYEAQLATAYRIGSQMHPDVAEEGLQVIFDINDGKRGHEAAIALCDAYLQESRT